jgi:hypothetical protein
MLTFGNRPVKAVARRVLEKSSVRLIEFTALMRDRFEDEAAGARTEAADSRYDDRHREGNMPHAMRPQR